MIRPTLIRPTLVLAMLLSSLASAAYVPSATADGMVKQLTVRSAAEIKSVFGLSAGERRQEIEISCSPAGSSWCAKDFVAACDKNGGGMSSDPDGGVTCSLPQHE